MKALRFHDARDLRLDEVSPPPEALADQVVLKVLNVEFAALTFMSMSPGPSCCP
jgi:hypothetical protein